jgi:PKD repeat protein
MRITLLIILLFSIQNANSQINRCATDEMVSQEIILNPNKKIALEQLELFTQDFISNLRSNRRVDTTYIIPVVVHVVHDYGDERIETSQVESAIKSICDDFNLSNDDFIDSNGNFISSTANNNDTVYVLAPDLSNNNMQLNWLASDNSSVQKNEEICVITTEDGFISIIAEDIGNNKFCGGIINLLSTSGGTVFEGDTIAYIITTEARGFEDIASNIGIEFRLATIDPNGNCTTGITYNQSKLTFIGGENIKDDSYWDNSKYLNIWTVANVASGAAAYAYYPGSAPTNHEGILCQHDYFGTTGTSSNGNWRRHTMSHEVGHYLNLAHPWGSTNDSAVEENCNSDDSVEDTPNTIGASGCTTWESQISCESLDNVANIMDYTNCAFMFTSGQKDRVIAALNSTSGARNNLWSESNLETTGTNDSHFFANPYADCTPISDFRVVGEGIGALGPSGGFSISFESMSYNVPENEMLYEWFFEGAEPTYSTEKNPTVTYINSGQHDVTLTVSNSSGNNELIKENYIVILDQVSAPFEENFESASFPLSESEDQPSWYILNNHPSENNWNKSNMGSYNGEQSIRIRSKSFSAEAGNITQQMYTPEINCTESTHTNENPFGIYFHVAYAKRLPYEDQGGNSVISDQLTISRKHVNQPFMARATFNVDELVSTPNTYFNEYSPSSNDWQEKFVNLGSSAGQESVIIRFEFSGQGYLSADTVVFTNTGGEYISNNVGGNWLYIDNVKVGNLEQTLQSNENEPIVDNRIFDLYGREYNIDSYLGKGVYIQNRKLIFIKD